MVKEATGSMDQASQILAATDLTILSGDDSMTLPLMSVGGGSYAAEIPSSAVTAAGVSYYLAATDTSAGANLSTLPAAGAAMPFGFSVDVPDEDLPVIVHEPIVATQAKGAPVTVTATVTDPSGVAEVRVYFRAGGTASFTSAALTPVVGDRFTGTIPAAVVMGSAVDYYLEAVDGSEEQNLARHPDTAPAMVHSFEVSADVVADTDGPMISHVPTAEEARPGFGVIIECTITDASGIATAVLNFRQVGAAAFITTQLINEDGTNTWRAQIPGTHVLGTGVEYYFTASDGSASQNGSILPAAAPGQVFIVTIVQSENPGGDGPQPRDEGCACAASEDTSTSVGWAWLALPLVLLLRRRR